MIISTVPVAVATRPVGPPHRGRPRGGGRGAPAAASPRRPRAPGAPRGGAPPGRGLGTRRRARWAAGRRLRDAALGCGLDADPRALPLEIREERRREIPGAAAVREADEDLVHEGGVEAGVRRREACKSRDGPWEPQACAEKSRSVLRTRCWPIRSSVCIARPNERLERHARMRLV